MARKKRPPEPDNHERWMVSYADFITLLFALFVVMFASAQGDKWKAQDVSDSVKKALHGNSVSSAITSVLGGTATGRGGGGPPKRAPVWAELTTGSGDKELAELLPSLAVLSEELKAEIEEGRVRVDMQTRGLVISFAQAALFPSGGDDVSVESYQSLERVAAAIVRIPNPVRMEGHTDSRPIHSSRFHSNWDLSAARSIALLKLFSERFHVPAARVSIAGYADNAPIASNSTEEGRARNRRVDVVILNEQGVLAEPRQVGAGDPKPLNANR